MARSLFDILSIITLNLDSMNTLPDNSLSFRWSYIIAPLLVLALAVIAAAVFFPFLPSTLAYSFMPDAADSYAGRGAVMAWTVAPQFLLALVAWGIVQGAVRLSLRIAATGAGSIHGLAFSVMVNLMAMPQLILAFAMMDIFVYNLFQTHLMPVWIFAVIVMALGGVFLGAFFIKALRYFVETGKE